MERKGSDWRSVVESGLPPEERWSERNRAITERYARWYLDHPRMFKWAGMAAFASRQVGLAVLAAELLDVPGRRGDANPLAGMHRMAASLFMREDLDVIRSGNNAIFRDIAWAHAAYLAGGLEEVAGHVAGEEGRELLEGFSLIDRGVLLYASGTADEEAEKLIWEGNIMLLRHEQTAVLQPVFDRLSPGGRILASLGSELDFSGTVFSDSRCVASFTTHCGYLETLSGMKSVADPEVRWDWVASRVIPSWMEADRRIGLDESLRRELISMASGEPGVLHRVSGFLGGALQGG